MKIKETINRETKFYMSLLFPSLKNSFQQSRIIYKLSFLDAACKVLWKNYLQVGIALLKMQPMQDWEVKIATLFIETAILKFQMTQRTAKRTSKLCKLKLYNCANIEQKRNTVMSSDTISTRVCCTFFRKRTRISFAVHVTKHIAGKRVL